MKRKVTKIVVMALTVSMFGCIHSIKAHAENVSVGTFNELMSAVSYAQDGDVIEIGGYIQIPVQTDLGYPEKTITLKRTDASSRIEFSYDAGGSSIQNIIFDGDKILAGCSMIDVANGISMNNVKFQNCVNEGGSGGAVTIWDAGATFNNCTFDGNGASDGAAVRVNGGSSIVFNDCSFTNGIAVDKGGVIRIGSSTPTVTFSGCSMIGNKADIGGAIYASCKVIVEGCVFDNTANSGSDVYIDDYGFLVVNSSIDEIKSLYEAVSLSYNGVMDEETEEYIETPATITGAKGIVFNSTKIEQVKPTPEPDTEPNPTPQTGNSSGSSGSSASGATYNQTYNPTINNTVNVPESVEDSTTSEPVEVTAAVSDGKEQKVYEAALSDNGDSSLEIKEGENTITININVGIDETKGTDEAATAVTMTSEPKAAAPSETATPEKLYITKSVNWVDVVELLVIFAMALYLFWDKLKVKFQGSKRR